MTLKVFKMLDTELMERFFDIIISIILVFVLSPLSLVILIVVVIESHGRPFFRQRRVGKEGKEFIIYKFRTMKTANEGKLDEGSIFKPSSNNDPRITRLGFTLRRTHLDELPQLINVIKGDMSLVGVRPDIPAQISQYTEDEWRRRNRLRPGITGKAQISLAANHSFRQRLKEDLDWTENNSIFTYFKCIFFTIIKMFKMTGV